MTFLPIEGPGLLETIQDRRGSCDGGVSAARALGDELAGLDLPVLLRIDSDAWTAHPLSLAPMNICQSNPPPEAHAAVGGNGNQG